MPDNTATIFLRTADGKLNGLTERGYETEDYLQTLIAEHHELLAGDQIDDEDARRWLLVGREVGIPDMHGASDRWSIDHVFVDHEGIPTFVEVKRSSDARIRREVVGQLIEYASNAAKYWPKGFLRTRAERQAAERNLDLADLLRELLREPLEAGDFWEQAEQNLQRGVLRLIFIADKIPPELRRMAEFMNDQMTNTEVLAIEVRQYVGGGQSVMVPYVLNATERAKETKKQTKSASSGRRRPPLSPEEFYTAVREAAPGSEKIAEALLARFEELGCSLEWRQSGISVRFDDPRDSTKQFTVFVIRKNGTCEVAWLNRVQERGLDASISRAYIQALKQIGFPIAEGKDYSTAYPLTALQANFEKFVSAGSRFVQDVRAHAR